MKHFICLGLFFLGNFSMILAQSNTVSKNVSTILLADSIHHTHRKIWIYTPANYTQSKKRYPVLYVHDAQNLFDAQTSYAGEWNIDEKLDSLNAQVIVVGVEHGNEKRLDELTPYQNEQYGGGKAEAYLEFIIHTLKPEIDKKYRTKPDAKNTCILGSSLGGLVSLYAIMKYPNVFGKAGVFSPSLWFSEQIFSDFKALPEFKAKVYVLCGDHESENMVRDIKRLEYAINEKRCYCLNLNKLKIVPGGQHNEKLWRDGFVKAYLWLF
jgi:predicted alpha/beta superfamily hydrolase